MDNDSDSDVGDILNDLLANGDAEECHVSPPKTTLKELDFNFLDSTPSISNENKSDNQEKKSQVYDDTVDSSDDEDRRYFEEQKYSNYGRDIKSLLKKETPKTNEDRSLSRESSKTFNFSATKSNRNENISVSNTLVTLKDVYSDPFFGLRIVNPVVSSAELKARMIDKTPVTISKVKYHLSSERAEKDWVIAGVLINKSLPKTSQKGNSYAIWKISDLSENMNTVCLFMFSNAYKTLWKTTIGTVIGVLNPNVLESKDSTDLATLSTDNPQKVMILGKSKDMGKCRSIKKNGEPCNSIVNISRCEFCLYHIKQEYKKCSSRAELQSFSNTQKFSIDMFKNKPQQPRKPLYDSMPEFIGVVAVKSKKLEEKDAKRLALLSGSQKMENSTCTNLGKANDKITKAETPKQQIKKDSEQMRESRGCIGCLGGTIDLSEPITKKQMNVAKNNALKWVKENGKIKAKNPNKVRLNKEEKLEKGKKRPRELENSDEPDTKKSNVVSDKFKEMLQVKSAHTDLIEKSYEQEKEKYFNKLEMKERMEEKMLTTYKVPCKAVKCLLCKYTSFSASEICKEQKHPLRVSDAVKRFFKCADCGNRTVSLDRIPSHSCIKCSSSNWTRAAMMDERRTKVSVSALSIRGDEESYLGSSIKDANLNLLIPETDDK
ncbi:Protein MCM10 like protein [Habropoda laboriosa]|uniref:Protein MCM10 homolog n=1 Tax=Habropoda laboriosa TaxID=597456 RepID=A0A0L7QNG6_9HYME|nr:Protein MCM10 like protein [Habropoda laboriosa]